MKGVVAIVGRPNVGKSSLFNRILRDQRAVVDDEPGSTRDRNYASTHWRGKPFVIVDTGGYVPTSRIDMERFAREQAEVAMSQADVILLVVDVTTGISDLDGQIAQTLLKRERCCLVVANKADNEVRESEAGVFGRLGLGEPIAVSALSGRNAGDMLDRIVALLPEDTQEADTQDAVRIAVVGRPNVGKSSFVNAVCGENRAIVHEAPGTTRDSLDTEVIYGERRLTLVDTAGLRGMQKIRKEVEFYASLRTIRSLERCHVALVIVDSSAGVTVHDVKILAQVMESRKGAVLVANKWDLVEKDSYTADRFVKEIREAYPFVAHIPVVLTSALTGKRTHRVLDEALEVHERGKERVATSELNAFLEQLTSKNPPPMHRGRQPKLLYCTQHGIQPPSFVFFCNSPGLIQKPYRRYIENQIRERFGFEGCPISIRVKGRS
jgi:GTP-binding protein